MDRERLIYWAVYEGDAALAGELLTLGAGPEEDEGHDESALHLAAERGDPNLVRLLLEAGWVRFLDAFDYLNRTPLARAAEAGSLEAAEVLLEAGADVSAHNEPEIGETALHAAVQAGQAAIVALLLRHGADPAAPGWMQLTPVHRAENLPASVREPILALLRSPGLAFQRPMESQRKQRRRAARG
jgi:ankyrin repeat protein